jgi:hypothetical protein
MKKLNDAEKVEFGPIGNTGENLAKDGEVRIIMHLSGGSTVPEASLREI